MPAAFLHGLDPQREALLDAVEAYLKPFKCYLVANPEDDGCWHLVDPSDDRVGIVEIRDLEAFARENGITRQP
jgi:hypothetical protein